MSAFKHRLTVEVVERAADGMAVLWLASCQCKTKWTGGTYEQAEDRWRQHVHGITGTAPGPMGSLVGRWSA